ncbi:RDD family protein [Ignatzschineria sp. LJL83]
MTQTNQNHNEHQEQYCVRFLGEMLPGYSKETAIINVATAYNVAPEEIAKWFAENGVTLREKASKEEVKGLERFFNQHGMRLAITVLEVETSFAPQIDSLVPPATTSDAQITNGDYPRNESSDAGQDHLQSDKKVTAEELGITLQKLQETLVGKELAKFMPAPLWKRTLAFIIDYLTLSFLSLIAIYILGSIGIIDSSAFKEYFAMAESSLSTQELLMNPDLEPIVVEMMKTLNIWVSLIFILYFGLQERYYGATLGKRIFNMRVYNMQTGVYLSWNCVIKRTFLFYLGFNFLAGIPVIGGILFLISILWVVRDPRYRRTLYDIISGTIVGSTGNKP